MRRRQRSDPAYRRAVRLRRGAGLYLPVRFAIDANSATTLIVCGVEVYAPKRVLDIAWDHAGTAELIGYGPGEWEGAVKAAKD